MPIYAFECTACGHSFERLQRLADADPDHCPECRAEAIRRQLTAPQFRLAGGGWYETDFKQAGDKQRNLAGDRGAPTSTAAQAGGKSETKADSKPAAAQPVADKPQAAKAGPKAEPARKSAAAPATKSAD